MNWGITITHVKRTLRGFSIEDFLTGSTPLMEGRKGGREGRKERKDRRKKEA